MKEIKSVSLKYCVDLLTNREPKDKYKRIMDMKNELHDIRMKKSHHNDNIKLTRKYFDKTISDLKKKSQKYKFITNSGDSFKDALFNLII